MRLALILALLPAAASAQVLYGSLVGNVKDPTGAAVVGAAVEQGTFHGTRLRLRFGAEERVVQTRLIGTHNVYNILGAAACTWAMGYDLDHIRAGIEALAAVPGKSARF